MPIVRPLPTRDVDNHVTELPALRFAVATLVTWGGLRSALQDLHLRGLAFETFNCVSLQRVLADKDVVSPYQKAAVLQELAFPDSQEVICCTPGALAECLAGRRRAGAQTLQAALSQWLIPRHATHFQCEVEQGRIVLWVQLSDADDERRAYQSLLANSSNSVGVHDLVASPAPKN